MRLERTTARFPSIAVWLPEPAKTAIEQARRSPRAQYPTDSTRPRDANKPTDTSHVTGLANAPASNSITLPQEASGPVETPAAPHSELNLTLSRKDIASVAPRSFAEQSPFRGKLPATVERQIAAAAAQSGPWTEERVDHDHIRFRRGNTCVMMQRPRAASIDPFSEAAARLPWRANVTDCGD